MNIDELCVRANQLWAKDTSLRPKNMELAARNIGRINKEDVWVPRCAVCNYYVDEHTCKALITESCIRWLLERGYSIDYESSMYIVNDVWNVDLLDVVLTACEELV